MTDQPTTQEGGNTTLTRVYEFLRLLSTAGVAVLSRPKGSGK